MPSITVGDLNYNFGRELTHPQPTILPHIHFDKLSLKNQPSSHISVRDEWASEWVAGVWKESSISTWSWAMLPHLMASSLFFSAATSDTFFSNILATVE
jgi:hypothetical protein